MTVAVMVGNRRASIQLPYQNNFSPASCHRGVGTVFLIAFRLRRVRLVVRTQPSQGWYTGSTPVRAAIILKQVRALNDPLIIEAINLFNAEVRDVI